LEENNYYSPTGGEKGQPSHDDVTLVYVSIPTSRSSARDENDKKSSPHSRTHPLLIDDS